MRSSALASSALSLFADAARQGVTEPPLTIDGAVFGPPFSLAANVTRIRANSMTAKIPSGFQGSKSRGRRRRSVGGRSGEHVRRYGVRRCERRGILK